MDLGDKWNGWTIDSFIGEGTYGRVYKIVRTEFGHTYESALKVISIPQSRSEITTIRNEGMDDDSITTYFKGMVEDIVSEFAIMSELKGNSNIVSYEDHSYEKRKDSFGWDIYIRMELLTPLFVYMREHTFTIRDAIQLGIDICKALEICQKYNIIHRDVKPENIFVSKLGAFKLGDFGIARQLENATSSMSKKGTYSYMAPEVYKGEPYNSTVDTYSLGIVLYRILNNNRLPFLPAYPNAISYSDRQKANIRRLSGDSMSAPCFATGRLAEIILKACAYDPKDRYESPRDMREALESISYSEEERGKIYPSGDVIDHERSDTEPWIDSNSSEEPIESENSFKHITEDIIIETRVDSKDSRESDPTKKGSTAESAVSSKYEENSELVSASKSDIDSDTTPDSKLPTPKADKKVIIAFVSAIVILFCCIGVYRYYHHPVPNVVGMTAEDATVSINEAGLTCVMEKEFSDGVERGQVISQTHQGKSVKKGTEIQLTVSAGTPVAVPELKGLTEDEAKDAAEKAGLKVVIAGEELSENTPKGGIISQSPDAGTGIELESKIEVIMSKGIIQVEVPDVVGSTEDDARKKLEEVGLQTGTISYEYSSTEAGLIISQSVEAGKKVDKHSTIDLVISSGAAPVQKNYNGGGSSKKRSTKKKSKKEADWS